MKLTYVFVAIFFSIGTVGCESTLQRRDGIIFESTIERITQASANKTEAFDNVRVGEVMASFQPAGQAILETTKLYLDVGESSGEVVYKSRPMLASAEAGEFRLTAKLKNELFFEKDNVKINGNIKYGGVVADLLDPSIVKGIFWTNSRKEAEITKSVYFVPYKNPLKASLKTTVTEASKPNWVGVRREFIYNGISNQVLHFVYKEFTSENVARPAFTTLVDLDYAVGRLYVYQELEFEIEKAATNEIFYKIRRNFSK